MKGLAWTVGLVTLLGLCVVTHVTWDSVAAYRAAEKRADELPTEPNGSGSRSDEVARMRGAGWRRRCVATRRSS